MIELVVLHFSKISLSDHRSKTRRSPSAAARAVESNRGDQKPGSFHVDGDLPIDDDQDRRPFWDDVFMSVMSARCLWDGFDFTSQSPSLAKIRSDENPVRRVAGNQCENFRMISSLCFHRKAVDVIEHLREIGTG